MPASGLDQSEAHRAEIGGVELAWSELACSAPVEEGPPLVLVHGFTGHRDDFIGVLPALARRRRVIAPDLRGHGDSHSSAATSDYTFEQVVNDLFGLLEHLGIDRCDLLGHSMGGMITLRFALAHPDRVRALIFLCTGPEVPATLDRTGFEKASAIAAEHGMETLQTILEKIGRENISPIQAAWGERLWMHHRRRFASMTPTSYAGLGAALFESGSLVSRLAEIDAPTLIVVGEADRDWLPGADLFEAHLPNATRVTIAEAEHHPHQENPEAWLEAVEAHLARVSG
jgi:pimeloyl-ACP methyl ester carboxylesterase